MSLASDAEIGDFKASSTWCTLFMSRYKLSLRRTTNLTTLTDNQLIQQAVDHMKFLHQTLPTIALLLKHHVGMLLSMISTEKLF